MGDDATHYPRADLAEDARSLATTLEESHPDPYAGHGGRVAYHRNLEELIREIPDEGESVSAFYPRVAGFAARVRDLHTAVDPPEEPEKATTGRLPVGFRVVGAHLYVDEVYDEECADLLGGRLVAVEGVATADLEGRAAAVESAENEYGDRRNVAEMLEDLAPLGYLLDDAPRRLSLEIETRDGECVERTLEPVEPDAEPVETLAASVERPATDGEPAYRFLDDDGETALLALPDMRLYREHPEMVTAMDAEGSERMARDAYREVVGEPVPDELPEVVAAIPSATEVLTELVEEMADAGTETLVVDTRDNGGGNSALTYILLYLLYGWDGIADATADQISIPKDSDLYRRRFGDEGAVGDTDNPAGFDFESYFARGDADEQLDQLREQVRLTETFREEVESGDHEAFYRPENVVVVTSAGTASAGTEPAFLLSKLGASVVGVPSVQAPNKPRDLLPGELPNTGLDFRVSFRHVEFCPDADDGSVLEPDVELTPERFEEYDRARDAGVRLALDFADATDDSESDA